MEFDKRLNNTEYLNLEAPDTETKASLCIYSENIDIQAISALLGCNPTHSHKRGEKVKPHSPPSKTGLWLLDAPDGLYFPDKLTYLIETTTSNHDVWDKLASLHRIELSCAVFLRSWTDGFTFPAELMEEIGRRHWQFGISVYSAEGDEIVDAFLKPKNKTSDK
jgi:hypothetical protein